MGKLKGSRLVCGPFSVLTTWVTKSTSIVRTFIMASETSAANPELLQEQVANRLVQPLEAASVVLSSGVRIFDTHGPLRIPKLTAGASVGFVAEGGLIPEADVDFGEISLMPSTLKSLKVRIRFTNEQLRQSVIGLDATLRQRLVTDVSNALDQALLTGQVEATPSPVSSTRPVCRPARWTSPTRTASSTRSRSRRPPGSPRTGGSSTAVKCSRSKPVVAVCPC